jgi:hypothetical protein
MNDTTEIVQQSVQGVGLMKTGSSVTLGGTAGVFLLDSAQIVSLTAVLIGTAVGIAGYIYNRRDARARRLIDDARERREQARERREVELHAHRMSNLKDGEVDC